jgi:hypothetical protein
MARIVPVDKFCDVVTKLFHASKPSASDYYTFSCTSDVARAKVIVAVGDRSYPVSIFHIEQANKEDKLPGLAEHALRQIRGHIMGARETIPLTRTDVHRLVASALLDFCDRVFGAKGTGSIVNRAFTAFAADAKLRFPDELHYGQHAMDCGMREHLVKYAAEHVAELKEEVKCQKKLVQAQKTQE